MSDALSSSEETAICAFLRAVATVADALAAALFALARRFEFLLTLLVLLFGVSFSGVGSLIGASILMFGIVRRVDDHLADAFASHKGLVLAL